MFGRATITLGIGPHSNLSSSASVLKTQISPCKSFTVLRRVRNCQCYYYYYHTHGKDSFYQHLNESYHDFTYRSWETGWLSDQQVPWNSSAMISHTLSIFKNSKSFPVWGRWSLMQCVFGSIGLLGTSGYATWFTAGAAIRIARYDVIDDVITRKL